MAHRSDQNPNSSASRPWYSSRKVTKPRPIRTMGVHSPIGCCERRCAGPVLDSWSGLPGETPEESEGKPDARVRWRGLPRPVDLLKAPGDSGPVVVRRASTDLLLRDVVAIRRRPEPASNGRRVASPGRRRGLRRKTVLFRRPSRALSVRRPGLQSPVFRSSRLPGPRSRTVRAWREDDVGGVERLDERRILIAKSG